MFQRWIYNRLKVPERMESVRPRGTAKMTRFERQFDYLRHTTPKKHMTDKERAKLLKKIERYANWLDNALPAFPISIGIDSLLSFIPIVGPLCGALFALYQVYLSTLFGIPLWLLLRMMTSLVIDAVLSSIPFVGGFLDLLYKANLWNYEALCDYLDHMDTAASGATSSSSSSAPTEPNIDKHYQDIATTEISWTQLFYDIKHINTSLITWIHPKNKQS
ncbi:hypothetical protein BDA99DRAFT_562156 [Phascolomyces articulosus]|uniref:DUF4112 domain-containing protein n=1 Tax=Phascolomyces articulosus TaxID=60185 RepID=A0AAD5JV78_9FUNG|nr:hypothetical protein BDA99DRAFT_562156 [Phascolomyces articulosus]